MIILILTVQLEPQQPGEVLSLPVQVKSPGDLQVLLVQAGGQVPHALPADVLQGLAGIDRAALLLLLPLLVQAVEQLGGDGVAALLELLLPLHLLLIRTPRRWGLSGREGSECRDN